MNDIIKFGDSIEASIKPKINHINKILEEDGGGCEFIDFEDGVVKIRLKGACSGCPGAEMTVSMIIETELKDHDDRVKSVEVVA